MLKDLFFPKTCLGCGFLGCYICRTCEKKLSPITLNTCLYCARASYLGATHQSCKTIDGIDGMLSLYSYNPILRAIIKKIKYRGVYDAFHELFHVVREPAVLKFYKFKRLYNCAVLQPIPLHTTKMKSRGFNQSAYIAGFFEALFGYKKIDLLIRSKATSAQAQIKDRQSRAINMKDAFSLKTPANSAKGISTLIIVDDVVTTGSTVKEAAKVLKSAGIEKVFVFSFGRG